MTKKSIAIVALVLAFAGMEVWAGDSANFVDLGFSVDGKVYMFAQYGVETVSLKPWAELFVVDVPRNTFFKDGVEKTVYDTPVLAGQDGIGAFHRLLSENAGLAVKYKVDHLRQGTPLYLLIGDGSVAVPAGDKPATIDFRDFESGTSYKATLVPYIEGSGATLASSFYITVDKTLKNGSLKKYTVGTPAFKRPGVMSYTINRVISAPKDGSLIFVIEMRKTGERGSDLRYMVEAFRL